MIGKLISHYKILEELGRGGMGVVYKAEDTKLDRFVALKFLPERLTTSNTERARFLQEAKAASALNHPNVCTIYDIKEHDGQQFIVMEYVDGQTLRALIDSNLAKVQNLRKVIDYALQIGDALKEAHAKGIVHRDIKSENIMVNSKNQIKVMDFGLAKLKGSLKLTQTSSTVGTLSYMAPEQVQGEEVDGRADIFSFGVVLYEMLAGRLPFQGDYDAAVVYAIVNEEPEPIHKFRSELSSEFLHVLNRALEKDTEDRYQSVKDMLIDLRRLKKETSKSHRIAKETVEVSGREARQTAKTPKWMWPALALGLAALLLVFLVIFQSEPASKAIRLTNPRKITQAAGQEGWPTWSPDGSRIAYTSDQSGRVDIWITLLAGGEPVNMTKDMASACYQPIWSPDGSQIAFSTGSEKTGLVYVIPAIGGMATRIAAKAWWSNSVWSPDGTQLAYVVKDSAARPFAEIYTLTTHEKKLIPLPGTEFERTNLSWSPNGEILAYTDAVRQQGFLRIVHLQDLASVQITFEDRSVLSPFWSANSRILYFSSEYGGTRDLWQVRLSPHGEVEDNPVPVSNGLDMDDFSFSPDYTKIAYSRGESRENLWRVPIPNPNTPAVQWRDAEQLTFESSINADPEVSPDGQYIYFLSNRSGNQDIWSMRISGGDLRQVTTHPAVDAGLSLSPDGHTIAFNSRRNGYSEIWTLPVAGGPARQITRDMLPKYYPKWSPDGLTLAYVAQDSLGKLDIWVVPAQGGETRRVTKAQDNLYNILWWPDGQSVVTFRGNPLILMRFEIHSGSPQLLDGPGLYSGVELRWSKDKQYIYTGIWNDQSFSARNIWSVAVADGSVRQLTDFSGRPGFLGRFFATDGTYFYFTWREDLGDIWVMDVEREK